MASVAVDDAPPGPARPLAEGPARRTGTELARARLPWPVLLYLFAVVLPIAFQAGPLYMTTLRAVLLLFTVPLALGLLLGRFGRVYATDLLFMLHLAWVAAALAVNNPDEVVQQVGSVGIEFLGGYLIGRAYIRTPEAFGALCRALGLIICCTLPFALFEAQSGRPLIIEWLRQIPGLTSVAVINIDVRLGLERVQGTFAHPIHNGLFCSVAFSLTLVALKDVVGTARRYLTAAVVALCGLLALSSGALLAIALQMALIAWSTALARVRARWWILAGLFAFAYVVVDLVSSRTPLRVFMSYATFSAHNAYWRGIIFEWGMINLWGSPLFGIGLNDWVRPSFMRSASMDNFWLVMAVRYGIPGFLFLAAGFALALFHVMRRNFEGDAVLTHVRRAWVFTFLGLSFTLCTVHVWTNIYSFVFFMFGAGLWLIAAPAGAGAPTSVPTPATARGTPHRVQAVGRPVGAPTGARAPLARAEPDPREGPPVNPLRPATPYSRFPAVRRRGAPDPSGGSR